MASGTVLVAFGSSACLVKLNCRSETLGPSRGLYKTGSGPRMAVIWFTFRMPMTPSAEVVNSGFGRGRLIHESPRDWLAIPYVNELYRGVWERSPDRSRLAFLVDDGDSDGSETLPDDGDLWVWTVGEGVEWLSADVRVIEWSTDGLWLVYWVPDGRSDWDWWHRGRDGFPLWIWSSDKGVHEQISSDVWTWRWSPDGTYIAHYKAIEGEHMDVITEDSDFGELWVWSVGEGNSGLVTDRADRIEWGWSPSGNHLVYGNEIGTFMADAAKAILDDVPH